jgi:hypothetical protein
MLFSRRTIQRVLSTIYGMWGQSDAGGAGDPLAGVRQPVRRGPGGRSSAIALREPEGDAGAEAVGDFTAPASMRSPR